jgi:hypothetical protein
VDLHHADLAGIDLETRRKSRVDLSYINLEGVNFTNASLNRVMLTGSSLAGADLTDARLVGAWVDGVDFSQAILFGTDFRTANFTKAQLNETKGGATFKRACFYLANLSNAMLIGADLSEVDFRRANVIGASLYDADLSKARVGQTVFAGVDLCRVRGLETIIHEGSSTIGMDTIYQSGGQISEVFLRGCGIGDEFIAAIRALGGAIQFYSCFISYSNRDQDFAKRLHADLRSKGVRSWFAPEDLKIGDKLRSAFDEAIRLHDKLMVILSENSVKSPWVEKEVETAFEKERQQGRTVLFPIRLDNAVMDTHEAWASDLRRTRHIGDFRDWKNRASYKKTFERLLRDLKADDKSKPSA